MDEPGDVKPRIQSVARAAGILAEVAASPNGLTPKQISAATGIRAATTYHLLHTLQAVGLLRRDSTGSRYVLGFAVGPLANAFERHVSVPEQISEVVREIADRTGEAVYGSGWMDGEIVILARRSGVKPVGVAEMPVGMAGHAFARASGKMLLALCDEEARERYFESHEHVGLTPNTWTRDQLRSRLEAIRKQGYAFDDEEHTEGVCCVAAPYWIGSETFCATLSAPAERFRANRSELVEAVLATTGRSQPPPSLII